MRSFIQFTLESSLVLSIFVALYYILFRHETSAGFIRRIMMAGVLLSLILPALHFRVDNSSLLPVLSSNMLTSWLPEVIIGNNDAYSSEPTTPTSGNADIHDSLAYIYFTGVAICSIIFFVQLFKLIILLRKPSKQIERYRLVQYDGINVTFSFFNTIVIGKLDSLSDDDRSQILRHEKVHADQFHSIDLLTLDILKIIFWFSPLIGIYKNILVQLHEFEADARSVENSDVDHYCSLMARVALETSGIKVASYFHKSLTLKRIEMIKAIKHKISRWKIFLACTLVSVLGVVVACEEQKPTVSDEQNIPQEAQSKFEAFKINHSDLSFMVENDAKKKVTMETLQEEFGEPVSRESFTVTVDGKDRIFELLEFASPTDPDHVYTTVDEMPKYPGGFEKMSEFLQANIKMPSSLKESGESGKSYISFVVEKDGSVSDVSVLRPFKPEADAEALRVIKAFPQWEPGKQKGKAVRVKFVIPIAFQ